MSGQLAERSKPGRDVLERDRLQNAAAAELLVEHGQRSLRRLAGRRQLIQEPRTVEVLDAGDPARVRIRAEVAPRHELGQAVGDGLGVGADGSDDLFGAQMHDESALGGDEGQHNLAVETSVLRRQVGERGEPRHRPAQHARGAGRNADDLSTQRRVPSVALCTLQRA